MRLLALVGVAVLLALAACDSGPGERPLQVVGEPRVTVHATTSAADGRVKNTGSRPYSGLVKVTLFDAGGQIVGVLTGAVNSVPPGEEATYTAVGTDTPAAWARAEARVDTQIPG